MKADPQDLLAKYEPKEVKVLKLDRQVTAARFSPCGDFLVGGGLDGPVLRWDVTSEETPELSPLEGHRAWVEAYTFDPQGKHLFTADSWGELCCWEYAQENPQPIWKVDDAHNGWIRCVAVSADGKTLATCGMDQTVRLWSTQDGTKQQELVGHGEDVFRVLFHPDGKRLLSGDMKGVVKLWDLATGQCVREFDAGVLYVYRRIQEVGGVRAMALDQECKTLACGGTSPETSGNVTGPPTLLLFDFESGELKKTIQFGDRNDVFVHDVIFHTDGFIIAVTSGTPGKGKFLLWRPQDEEPFFVTTKLANPHSVSLHPNGKRLAVIATNRGSNGNGRRLDKDGKYAGNNSPIHLFEFPTPEKAAT